MATSIRRPARQLAFRWHVVGLAAVSLLPVVAFAAVLVGRSAYAERARTEHELVMRAQLLAAAVDREVAGSLRALGALADSEPLARGDLEGFRHEAVHAAAAHPAWHAVVLLDPGGRRLVDAPREAEAAVPDEPASLAAAVRLRAPVVGDLVRARDGTTWVFALRAPVLVAGQLRYVLTAVMSAEEIGRALALGGADEVEWARVVLDRTGSVVARTRDPEAWVGRRHGDALVARLAGAADGVFRGPALDGFEAAIGFARAPSTGWTAAVLAPAARVDAPVRRSTALVTLAGLTSILLSGSAAFLLSRRFARALGSAADAAQGLASGARPAVSSLRIAEVARLGDALASSARLLEARREEGDRLLAAAAAARRAAEDSSRAKDEFLAMLGHELRNPLSPIVTALHLLRQRGPWGREHEIIARQTGHLVQLVDDLLDVSRVTRAKIRLRPERLELADVVRRAVEMTSPLFEERLHRLTVDVPRHLALDGDPLRLAQVLANLLTNAARYTPPGGHVAITARREGDRVAVEVSDDGQGLSAELQPRVFELFSQGPRGPDRAEGGLGLGLALVRSLVALHGGTVEARSAGPGCGSTFRVVLPAGRIAVDPVPVDPGGVVPGGVVPLATARARAVPRLRLLVVDDNADAAALLADFLGQAGHAVQVAHDGPAALAAAEAAPPDVVILDVGLPVMDGYEVAEHLRRRLGAAAPALVGLTGYGQERDRARGRQAGFLHHLVKPADPAEILGAVEDAAGVRGDVAAPGAHGAAYPG